jgi:MoxR-like ATPase
MNQSNSDFSLRDAWPDSNDPRKTKIAPDFLALSALAHAGVDNVPLEGEEVKKIADLAILCFLTEGVNNSRLVRHVLIEGVNGTGKTVLAKSVARALMGEDLWNYCAINKKYLDALPRITGRPDLTPQDMVGGDSLANDVGGSQLLKFYPGPLLFTSLVFFVDELNRTPPRTLNVLLEAMAESQVTIFTVDEKQTRKTKVLNEQYGLFVIAAQNPEYQEGTFALPEALLDRFMVKVPMSYTLELNKLLDARPRDTLNGKEEVSSQKAIDGLKSLVNKRWETLQETRTKVNSVKVSPEIKKLAAALTYATWNARRARQAMGSDAHIPTHPHIREVVEHVRAGVTPRGTQALVNLAQARAWVNRRPEVEAWDLGELLVPVFRHRILLEPAAPEHDTGDAAWVVRALRDAMPWVRPPRPQ